MPKLMSMKDFLAGGGASVKTYKNTGGLPSYVAQPKMSPKGMNKGMKKGRNKGMNKKKK